jgi:hypothetical protein
LALIGIDWTLVSNKAVLLGSKAASSNRTLFVKLPSPCRLRNGSCDQKKSETGVLSHILPKYFVVACLRVLLMATVIS